MGDIRLYRTISMTTQISSLSGTLPQTSVRFSGNRPVNASAVTYNTSGRISKDEFVRLAKDSGEADIVQGAVDEPKRLPYMVAPKPIVVTAKDQQGKLRGLALGTNYGEYGYLSTLMVDKPAQRQGIGKQLVREFQQELVRQCGGPASVAALSADPNNLDNDSHKTWLQLGAKQLPNALYIPRGTVIQ